MRHISPENLEEAKRLKKLWNEKKSQLGLTQQDVASRLNWTQGAISQYLNGHTALNTDTILTFARLLQISPNRIRPGLLNDLKRRTDQIMIYTISGNEPTRELWQNAPDVSENSLLVYVDVKPETSTRAIKGDWVVFRTDISPQKGDELVKIDHTNQKAKISSRLKDYTGVVTSIRRYPD